MMSHKYDKYLVLFGAFLIELALDSYYLTASSQSAINEYMNQNNSIVNKKDMIWISNTIVIGMGVTFSFGGYLEKKIGSSITILIGGWLLSINVCLLYLTLKTNLSIIIITCGFIGGCGAGIAYGVALGLPIKWFHKNKGLILGITISGFGITPTIFDILKELLLLENGKRNPMKLPLFFLILGLSFALIQGIGLLLISRPLSNQFDQNKFDSKRSLTNSIDNLSNKSISKEIEPHHIIFEYDFWILWLIMFLNSSCDTLIISSFYNYTQRINLNVIFGQTVILSMTGALCNCLGRLILGHLVDRFPFKIVMLSMTVSNMIFIGTIPCITLFNGTTFNIVCVVWFGIINFSTAGNFSVFPAMFLKLFGKNNFVFNYGMLYTSTSISSVIFTVIIMYFPQKLEYLFITGGVISFLAALLTLLFRGKSLIIYNV